VLAEESRKRPWRDASPSHSFILEYGEEFLPGDSPKGIRLQPKKRCFSNAERVVSRYPSLLYAEGYALSRQGLLFHHAWCTDGTNAFDPTLRDARQYQYLGIAVPRELHLDLMLKHRAGCVLEIEGAPNTEFFESWSFKHRKSRFNKPAC
jgi:hypothetical protein